jgi:hypothetical protein
LAGSLVVDHLLLRDFGPCVIIFMNVCVVITVAMVMLLRILGRMSSICLLVGDNFLLRGFGHHGIIFMMGVLV